MTRQIHNKWPRKTLDRKTERSNPFHLSGRGPSPGCRILQLLPTLEAHTTATSKTKSLNSQSTLATMMRRGESVQFLQKGNLYYMTAYARYIRRRLIYCKYPYPSISIAYNRIPPHNRLSNSKTCQTHEIILIKPMFLSQKNSKPHWKRLRTEGKPLAYGRGGY